MTANQVALLIADMSNDREAEPLDVDSGRDLVEGDGRRRAVLR
jgi:hypothetical protein